MTIAPARPVTEILRRKAYQEKVSWQSDTMTLGAKAFDELHLFVRRLVDNNEPEFFYLHPEPEYGIEEPCCAMLQLGISLRSIHYQTILEAKIAQLNDNFQSKLGWLIGSMYSQVGTVEWDQQIGSPTCSQFASRILKDQFKRIDDKQISEGLKYLNENGGAAGLSSEEVFDRIRKYSVKFGSSRFRERAQELLESGQVFDSIGSRALTEIRGDASLIESISTTLAWNGVENPDEVAHEIRRIFIDRLKPLLSDATMDQNGRIKSIKGIVSRLAEDAVIRKLFG